MSTSLPLSPPRAGLSRRWWPLSSWCWAPCSCKTASVRARCLLLVVGAALGLTLYHAAFGFTSAWRVFINERRGAGLRAQMVMLALAVLLFFPALGAGTLFGQPVVGLVAPAGVSVVFGAFIFGIGMQLGGGCASGTLFTVGGGNARMLVTLLFFICRLADRHTPCGLVVCVAGVPGGVHRQELRRSARVARQPSDVCADRGRHRASGEAPPRPA